MTVVAIIVIYVILVFCVRNLIRDLFRILDAVGIIVNGMLLVAGINVRAGAVLVYGVVVGGVVARRKTNGAIMLSWVITCQTRTLIELRRRCRRGT